MMFIHEKCLFIILLIIYQKNRKRMKYFYEIIKIQQEKQQINSSFPSSAYSFVENDQCYNNFVHERF